MIDVMVPLRLHLQNVRVRSQHRVATNRFEDFRLFPMIKLKRSRYVLFQLQDGSRVDIHALLKGRIETTSEIVLSAISLLTESAHRTTLAELTLLGQISADRWHSRSELVAEKGADAEILDGLVRKGLLVSTDDDPEAIRLRQRETLFSTSHWHPYAALYHSMIKHPSGLDRSAQREGFDIEAAVTHVRERLDRYIAENGMPPPPFHDGYAGRESTALPLIEREGRLYQAMTRRRTVRTFDRSKALRAEDVAVLLYYVFGCHGYARLSSEHTILKRTSPSGGSLHPVEAYPLVRNVSGIEPGLYHYSARDHALSRLRDLDPDGLDGMVTEWAAGQAFVASAPLLVALTARFERNFWKYPDNVKTHSVVLLDAGHLSQTFYLVCSDLGLGACFVAHDGPAIERALALNGNEEGAIALLGCGIPNAKGADHGIDFRPFEPGMTVI